MKFKESILFLLQFIINLTLIHLAASEIVFENKIPHVKLTEKAVLFGKVEQSRDNFPYSSFLGIPYATVGERFSISKLLSEPNWEGVKAFNTPGLACAQKFGMSFSSEFEVTGGEDCLVLNIYVPNRASKDKSGFPVMFYIHEGGFISQQGAVHGPKYFMDEDIILITINYRLNVFGFLSTGDELVPGNMGLKDVVMALKWVQKYIKNFGGDANRVTIWGESSGGAIVHYLMLSSMADGLFQNAISQSGSAQAIWAYRPNPREQAVKLANFLKCPTTESDASKISSQEIVDCLRKESVFNLTKAYFTFGSDQRWPSFFFPMQMSPVTEPKSAKSPFLTESPYTILTDKSKSKKKVPFLTGVTEFEGAALFAGPVLKYPELVSELDSNWDKIFPLALDLGRYLTPDQQKTVAPLVRKMYFQDKPVSYETRQSLVDLYSDFLFDHPCRKMIVETTLQNGEENPVYLYRFTQKPPMSLFTLLGFPIADEEAKKVGHSDDLLFQFDLSVPGWTLSSEQDQFSRNFIKLWVSFATYGKPTHTWGQRNETWKPLTRQEVELNSLNWFNLNSNPSYSPENNEFKKRMTFLDQLFNDYFKPIY